MYTIQLGTFVLNGEIILYLAFALAGRIAMSFHLRRMQERAKLLSFASNALLIWLLVWKGSLLLFDPVGVVEHPESLLVYSGGERGRWLAGFAAAAYVAYRTYKQRIDKRIAGSAAAVYLLSGWALHRLGLSYFEPERLILHIGLAVLSIVALLSMLLTRKLVDWRGLIQRGALLVLAGLVLNGFYEQFQDSTNPVMQEGSAAGSVGIEKGQQAPDFQLLDIEGKQVQLSDYRGQTVFVNFWATWCPPCRAEMPHMQRFYENVQDQGVVVLGVNMTATEGNAGKVRSFVDDYGLTFPILMDEESAAVQRYRITAYPTTYVLDANGVIREKFVGAIDYETMKKAVDQIH